MKAWKVLAVVLASAALSGCVSKEKPQEAAGARQPVEDNTAADQHAIIVAQLLDVHHEAVGQMRVSAALRPQPKVECN